MTSALQLPAELWLHVFSFLPWKDKLSVRCTCSHFKHLLDKSHPLWRGFGVVLRHFSKYNHRFWRSLAQRHVRSVLVRSGKRKHLKQLSTWLPALDTLRMDGWKESGMNELKHFQRLQNLSITHCSTPLKNLDFLFPLNRQLTQLSLCNVQLTCSASHFLAAVCQLTHLTSLLVHHDGSLRVPTLSGVLTHLTKLKHLSWTMITYRMLSHDFFSPAHLSGGHPLSAYVEFLPSSLLNLTLCVDLQPEDLQLVSLRAPHLEHLHLEPWSSSSNLIRLLPQLFPHLKTLRIRHRQVSDSDFLQLQQLQHLDTLEVLDPYYKPDPKDPSLVINEPSPHLLQLISDLQKLTDYRVHVITNSHRDPIICNCV
uniref:uncharacterized protein LOC109972484 isoform X3 n=1 Tax=Monopterus albus TaxID=43700 RepID=UPI0009B3272E|nr:uncharacterized protein LOC109972484 isoform X3 [Monopterus albus]